MRVISLGSGSSGNALLVEAGPEGRTRLLVDVGIPYRILAQRLLQVGVTPATLRGVLLTHEHSDHMLGLPGLLKASPASVIGDPRTLAALRSEGGPVALQNVIELAVAASCVVGDIEVCSFAVSHDAVAPCGYLLSAGGCRVCVVLDSGEVTATMLEMMASADLLVLESNHDRARLLRGPYPYHLKMRILSTSGHLSNDQAAEAVLRTWRSDSVRWLWLSHLSRTNNSPQLALTSMRTSVQSAGARVEQLHISVLPPGLGGVWDSTQLWTMTSLWDLAP